MIEIETRGLDELQALFDQLPEVADRAATLAVNDTARFARRLASKEVRDQVAFKASYLGTESDPDANLGIARFASSADGEAVIRARDRVTSLARFSSGTPRFGGKQRGVRVKVGADSGTKNIPRAFYIKLRQGNQEIAEGFNVGLAIRLRKGERITNKREMKAIGGGLYLLYGPSVAQVFDDVAVDIQPEVSDKLAFEFVRQFERLSNG